jgi:hypothetical protein
MCHWDVDPTAVQTVQSPLIEDGAILSVSKSPTSPKSVTSDNFASEEVDVQAPEPGIDRVYCLTEQISHHPPVSGFYYYCPNKGIVARGMDHIAAKFTGTCTSLFCL